MLLRDIMTRNLEEIQPDASIREAAQKMRSFDVGALPVCQGEKALGIITDRDITIRAVADGRDPAQTKVKDAMTPGLVFCYEDEQLDQAVKLMEEKQVRRLLVLDHGERPVGIVSQGDIATRTQDDRLCGEVVEAISEPGHPQV